MSPARSMNVNVSRADVRKSPSALYPTSEASASMRSDDDRGGSDVVSCQSA